MHDANGGLVLPIALCPSFADSLRLDQLSVLLHRSSVKTRIFISA
jgi:hypothetical protein